jgi:hypothetical protein
LSYAAIATKVGKSEQHVIDGGYPALYFYVGHSSTDVLRSVCTGKVTPTKEEFNKLAQVLNIKDAVSDFCRQLFDVPALEFAFSHLQIQPMLQSDRIQSYIIGFK